MSIRAIAINPEIPENFIEIFPETPTPGEYDLRVEVKAASVNPVDTKVHKGAIKNGLQQPLHSRLGHQRCGAGSRQQSQQL